jgi:uncharacterized protein DUF3999
MSRTMMARALLFLMSSLAQAQVISPKEFAYGQLAIPTREAAAYRIPLPLTVYRNTFLADLGDFRVFNAEGVVVPFSLSRPTAQSGSHQAPMALPMFPLHEGARVLIDGVHLTINTVGSAVNLQTQNGTTTNVVVRQYLLDARDLDAALSALQLGWPDAASEFTGRMSVEVSDDLAAWRSLLTAAPIANLHANGQTLVANRVEFAPTRAKFWRLSWLVSAPSFELTTVMAEPADSPTEPARSSLDVIGAHDPKNAPEYTFDLNAHAPVSRINILLPEANTVIDVALSSRRVPSDSWRPVTRAGFYRVKTAEGEQQNSLLQIGADDDRYWQARILNPAGLPQAPLRLHVEWIPNEVTFLAQGHAPFLLAYGNASAIRAETDLSHLPSTLDIAPATLGPSQVSGGASRLIAKAAPFPRMRVALWSVLILAVVLLGWMAYRISKEPDDSRLQ